MRYISTRSDPHHPERLSFDQAVRTGLAPDGGLYVPESLPSVSPAELGRWAGLPYTELAYEVMRPFVAGSLSDAELRGLIDASYASFCHAEVTPVVPLGQGQYLLELFHGPTLAFKDVALQFLGRLLDLLLARDDAHALVLGATSGDTGSAAIAGCAASTRMDVVILYPHGRVSDVQRRQMTTVEAANVHALAVDGSFDDCQAIVKRLFSDAELRRIVPFAAVNSINWARILAQVVYYFYAGLRVGGGKTPVSFSVPTGNFGDIFAGYIAARMGLPVEKLIIASNRNDILTRCWHTGAYRMEGVTPTLSPSMDIEISSNFERLLFDLYQRDGATLAGLMQGFASTKTLTLSEAAHQTFRARFAAHASDDEATLAIITQTHRDQGMLVDPHTAVGLAAARALAPSLSSPVITLATAHPAKFPDAVMRATGLHPPLPEHLSDLLEKPERFTRIANDADAVRGAVLGVYRNAGK